MGRIVTVIPRMALFASLSIAACSHRAARRGSQPQAAREARGSTLSSSELSLRGKDFQAKAALMPVPFDYDSYAILEQARQTLRENARSLGNLPRPGILIEGHCDERGTAEYNLALGQRRARAVRDYYVRLGLPLDRIATISFGEEKPACSPGGPSCWETNRRAETRLAH